MNGIIVINKACGYTSHQVVRSIRRLFPGVKTGHTGTLDPMATGVLPVCLGKATRIAEYVVELPKKYRAEITLGTTTDTEDAQGTVLTTSTVPVMGIDRVKEIISGFTGTIKQQPPLYSAVKYRGKPLYHWTRRGTEVPRRTRKAEIYGIDLLEYNPGRKPHLVLEVQCSKGTYIRTLAADIGRKIGCGAHLSSLIRLNVGPFELEESYTVEEVTNRVGKGHCGEILKPMDSALTHMPALKLGEKEIKALKNGQPVAFESRDGLDSSVFDVPVRIYDTGGNFKAIAARHLHGGGTILKTMKYLSD